MCLENLLQTLERRRIDVQLVEQGWDDLSRGVSAAVLEQLVKGDARGVANLFVFVAQRVSNRRNDDAVVIFELAIGRRRENLSQTQRHALAMLREFVLQSLLHDRQDGDEDAFAQLANHFTEASARRLLTLLRTH